MKHGPQSTDYQPTSWHWFDREGNAIANTIFASRSYTEMRDPSGKVRVQSHPPKMASALR